MNFLYEFFFKSALFFLGLTSFAYAVETLPSPLVNLTSAQGLNLFKKDLNENALKLLSHFTTQKTPFYCGVASVVMVLNASSLTPPPDAYHPPYRYFNQEDFFNDKVKNIITPEDVQKRGISLVELSKVMQSYGLNVKTFFADQLDVKTFRKLLKQALANQQFIIVNFLRTSLHEQGSGHHSPLAAYDEKSDSFLLLDVARYKYPAYWIKTKDLWAAVHTKDDTHYRGFIVALSPRE